LKIILGVYSFYKCAFTFIAKIRQVAVFLFIRGWIGLEEGYVHAQYVEVFTPDGTLRIVYEMTVGDLLVSSMLVLLIVYLLLNSVIKAAWRR
jgi:hypothetical protein